MRGIVCASAGLLLLLGACGGRSLRVAEECPVAPGVPAEAGFEQRASAPAEAGEALAGATAAEYILRADSGYALLDTRLVRLCGVHLVVHDSLGQRVAELTAATGEFDRRRETVVVRGGVRVELPLEGRRLQTEELHYEPREDRVWSPTETTFQQDGTHLRGDAFTADRHFRNITVQRARGRVRW